MQYPFGLNLGINSTSLGQISFQILHECFKQEINPYIFPIGQVDLSTQKVPDGFQEWLKEGILKGITEWSRKNPVIRNWHLSGSVESYSNRQILLSYFELDKATPAEINCVKNNYKVLFPSEYSKKAFTDAGCDNVDVINLPFDNIHFKQQQIKYPDDRIVFILGGKLEKRKGTLKVLKSWADEFGDNNKYFLNASIYNNFISPDDQSQILIQNFGGRQYWNINFLPWIKTNIQYNSFLNSGHIVLGGSGGESFGAPEFHCLGLGLHGVLVNEHGYKNFATKENSCLLDAVGMEPAWDGVFFAPGQPYNQGNIFTWDSSDFIVKCHEAIDRVKNNKINAEGLKLQERTVEKFVGELLGHL